MFKKGDRVLFDSQGTMYEGILVSNVYRVFTEKEIYADIYISAIKEQITVNIKHIKKIDEMKKINALEIHKKVSIDELYNKLDEEVKEIAAAILLNDIENLTEEHLDVMQVIVDQLNYLRHHYLESKDYNYVIRAKKLLPASYKQMRTVNTNYAELINIYHQRKNHRLKQEWQDVFCKWVEGLPYMNEFLNAK